MNRARSLALAAAGLCATGALFGAPALYVPGLAALLAAAVAPAWVRLSTMRASVQLSCPVARVGEGESVVVEVMVRRGLVPFPDAVLEPGPGGTPLRVSLHHRVAHSTISAVASRRGRQLVGPVRVRVSDPFGICTRVLVSGACELLVLPRVHPISERALSHVGEARQQLPPGASLEVDSLRAHPPGAPASRIHWPTVARTATLMERGFGSEADPRVAVVLDARRPESEESLDQALRAAASLCVHLARRGGCLLLLPGERRACVIGPDLRAWPALHARLALVAGGVAVDEGCLRRSQTTLLYVTASRAGPPAIGGRCWRVGPHALPGASVAFTVAGCAAQVAEGPVLARSA